MNFEKTDNDQSNSPEPENDIEKIRNGSNFRCLKSWIKVGVAAVGIYVASSWDDIKDIYNEKFQIESYSEDNRAEIDSYKREIREKLPSEAEKVILIIKHAEELSSHTESESDGGGLEILFDDNIQSDTDLDNLLSRLFSDKNGVYPKKWVRGQVSKITFLSNSKIDDKVVTDADAGHNHLDTKSTIRIYKTTLDSYSSSHDFSILTKLFNHELAHANDWETDLSLSSSDRYKLFISCYEGLMLDRVSKRYEYPQKYLDNNQLYTAVKEYWAEICEEYFSNPRSMLKENPRDFYLVDEYVKKNDPKFDIFDRDRGIFDPNTGEIKK